MTDIDLGTAQLHLEDYEQTGLRIGLFASSGAGKGYALGVILEDLIAGGYPVVAIDPESELWTFQEVGALVVGGKHGDAPLPWQWERPERGNARRAPDPILRFDPAPVEAAIGYALAYGSPLVFDLGGRDDERIAPWQLLEEGEALIEVFERLADRTRRPVVFATIEASLFAPQQVPGGGRAPEGLAGMAQRGRKRGVISIVETQRTQDIQKRVISQCNVRLFGRLDDKGDYDTVKAHLDGRTFTDMRNMPTGVFYLTPLGEEVRIRERRVTHGGATPTEGGEVQIRERAEPNREAVLPIIAALREAAVRANTPIPSANARTPREPTNNLVDNEQILALRRREAELEDELRSARATAASAVSAANAIAEQADERARQFEHDAEIAQRFRAVMAGLFGEGMPATVVTAVAAIDEERIVDLIRLHAPNARTAVLAPVAKLRADYLERAAERLYKQMEQLTSLEQEVLKFLLAHPAQQGQTSIARALGGDKAAGGGAQQKPYAEAVKTLVALSLIGPYRSGNNSYYRPTVDTFLDRELKPHEPTVAEMDSVRDRALSLLAGE